MLTFLINILISIDHRRQDLVRFIRKRDQRYKDHLLKQAVQAKPGAAIPSSGPSKQRQQTVPEYIEQDWQRVEHKYEDNEAGEWDEAEGGEEWECVACGRTFRSEAAWSSHERSRKHLKEVER
jgi:DnaJ homolog subfamily A member 5